MSATTLPPRQITKAQALRFVLLFGVISLFADICYEGARGTYGGFLQLLGMSAAVLGAVAGLGEFLGYGLRAVSGYLIDRTRRYWLIASIGYSVNLLVLPLLALVDNWYAAAAILLVERIGKAIRAPARDAMMSYAGQTIGRGWAFALHEALDQVGAVTGPLLISLMFWLRAQSGGDEIQAYQSGFAILIVPALAALAALAVARAQYPRPQDLEVKRLQADTRGLSGVYWVFFAAGALIAAAYADFPILAYHFQKTGLLDGFPLPLPAVYSIAMAVDALAALALGLLYDRIGMLAVIAATLLSALFAPFAFAASSLSAALVGVVLWGVGMGAQESILKAAIGDLISREKRAQAYGVFSTGFGIAWFLGSALIGALYTLSLPALIAFSVALQVAAAGLLGYVWRKTRQPLPA